MINPNEFKAPLRLPQDPKEYVKALLEMHKKYNDLVTTSFDKNPIFVQALDKACTAFMNKKCVSETCNNTGKSPELLAKYCNLLLKKRFVMLAVKDSPEKQLLYVFGYLPSSYLSRPSLTS